MFGTEQPSCALSCARSWCYVVCVRGAEVGHGAGRFFNNDMHFTDKQLALVPLPLDLYRSRLFHALASPYTVLRSGMRCTVPGRLWWACAARGVRP
eukprot:703897-Rhodomonas_salina.6